MNAVTNTLSYSWPRSVFWLLLVGVLLRLGPIHRPLLDAGHIRQCQTAVATRSLIREPGWHLSSQASWHGDLPARLLLELPLYNYLVMAVYGVLRNLDVSGKVVSILLWAAGFLALQGIWRRTLSSEQAFWANVLFVFAPLSISFGQAFMPEMLIQLLAFGFLLAILRYTEQPSTGRLWVAGGIGLLGLLVKTPEIVHLYGVAFLWLFVQRRLDIARRPSLWILLCLTAVCVKAWAGVMDRVNQEYFQEWTASAVLPAFLGSWKARLDVGMYRRIAGYLACFVLTPAGLPIAALGLARLAKARPWPFGVYWLAGVAGFYVVWAVSTAGIHSYYNLPALGPSAMLFGIGAGAFLQWARTRPALGRWAGFGPAALALLLAPCVLLGTLYLLRQDRITYESALWLKAHTAPEDIILVKANHSTHTIHYFQLPTFPYYAERRIWLYSIFLPESERQRAREIAKYALVTFPPAETTWLERWRLRIKQDYNAPEPVDWLEREAGFHRIYTNASFAVYQK
jgi:4-amino-4-deoxy-L-arabinose transferase-like glycosyltransferase